VLTYASIVYTAGFGEFGEYYQLVISISPSCVDLYEKLSCTFIPRHYTIFYAHLSKTTVLICFTEAPASSDCVVRCHV